jgi:hypothetical protein
MDSMSFSKKNSKHFFTAETRGRLSPPRKKSDKTLQEMTGKLLFWVVKWYHKRTEVLAWNG